MIRKLSLNIVLFVLFFPFAGFAEDEKPVVIAMPPFCDFSNCIGTSYRTMALRDKVSAELFQKYNCIIVSRSNGLTLSREHELSNIKQLGNSSDGALAAYLPAVDYSLNGYIDVRKKNGTGNTIGGFLFVNDLQNDTENNWKKYETETDGVDAVLAGIVKALNLKPIKKKYEKHEGKIDETWAVLPIRKLMSDDNLKEPSDRHLAIMMELSLQDSGKLKHIVDHNDIDKVLRELKISSLNSATENVAGEIAKLVGADKIVMGTESKIYKDFKFFKRLDLFLVDGKTTLIIDAVTADWLPLDADLDKIASELVLKFTERKHPVPELERADTRLLEKESALYEEILYTFGIKNVKPDFVAKYVDTIFLLSNKNDLKKYKLGKFLNYRILPNTLGVYQQDRSMSLQEKKILLDSIELLLKDLETKGDFEDVLLLRARAYIELNDTETAMNLINRYRKKYPDKSNNYVNALIAGCYYKQKDYDKVFEYLEQAGSSNYGRWVRAWTYLMLDKPEDDSDELQNLKNLHIGHRFHETIFMAKRIALTHKFDGADAAVNFVNKEMIRARRTLPEIQLELAKAYLAKGDKRAAKMIVDGIFKKEKEDLAKISWYDKFETEKWIDNLHNEIKTLAEKLESVKYEWWKLSDVIKIPSKYKIYIRPLGNPNTNMVNACVPIIEEQLRCKAEILPDLPMPEDNYCFFRKRGQYDCSHVWDRTRKAQKIPEDALMVVNVTEKNVFFEGWNYQDILSWKPTGEYCISIHHWGHVGNYESLIEVVAKAVLWCFNTEATNQNCQFKDCLFSNSKKGLVIKEKKYAICDNCKECLEKVDIDAIVKDFHRKYNRPMSYDRRNKKEWQDKYNLIVKEVLAEAEKKGTKPAFPSVTLENPKPGLRYKYFEFEPQGCKSTEHLDLMTPTNSGLIDSFSLSKIKREHHFGTVFEGYIRIPDDGKYSFYLTSDDGSRLFINDQEIINNGRRHSSRTYHGKVALKAGYHKIRVPYFQAGGSPTYNVKLYYSGPKILGQQVPAEVLFHKD